jgi:malonate transporter and related proteins
LRAAFLSLLPTFLLILVGWGIRRRFRAFDGFWSPAETLTYYLFFPALLLESTAKVSLNDIPVGTMAAVLIGAILVVSALTLALRPALGISGPAFTSLFQGAIRPNTYIATAIVLALYSAPGVAILSVAMAFVIPAVNLLSTIVLVRFASGAAGWGTVIGQVVRNPLILSILLGVALNESGIGLPDLLAPLVHILGQTALPIGLLAVGAGLDLEATRRQTKAIWASTALKLVAVPIATAAACRAAGIDGLSFEISVLYAVIPCSASAYILARQMGGDAELMAGIITATTLAAMISVPAVLILLG